MAMKNMRRTLWKVACLLCILGLESCSRQAGPQYFPISDGAQCDYSVEYMAPLLGVQKGRLRRRVDGLEKIRGSEYFKLVEVFSGIPGVEPGINYLRKTDRGIYQVSGKHRDTPEFLWVPFPLTVGSKWLVNAPEGQSECRVESEETAELWGRRYDHALKMTCRGQYGGVAFEESQYIAKGVGMVKDVLRVSGVTMEFSLEGYSK